MTLSPTRPPVALRPALRDALRNRPLVLFTIGFCAGITLSGIGAAAALALTVAGAALAVAGWRRTALLAAGILLAGAGCGALRAVSFAAIPATDISRYATDRFAEVTGQVAGEPDIQAGRRQIVVRASSIRLGQETGRVTGDLVVVQRDDPDQRWTDVDYGDRVVVRGILAAPPAPGNPGAFSWRDYLSARGIHCMLVVRRPVDVERLGADPANPVLQVAIAARERLTIASTRSLPPAPGVILPAILIGRRNGIPPDEMQDFVRTGTVHILASAGLHVGILAWWLTVLAGRLTLPRRVSIVGIVGLLWLYALAAGGRPSVTRAVIMASVYFLGILIERAPDLPTTLATAALVLVAYQPSDLYDTGFQLSFLTVGTLVIAMPLWQRLIAEPAARRLDRPAARKAVRYALDLAGISLFAQLGAAPVVAAAYNETSVTGLIANLLVVPALFVILPFGIVGALAASAIPAVGSVALAPAGLATDYVIAVVRTFGEMPGGSVAVVSQPAWTFPAFYILVAFAAAWVGRRWPSDPKAAADDPDQP